MACAPYACVRSLGVDAAQPRSSREAHASSAWPADGVRGRPIWSSGFNRLGLRLELLSSLVIALARISLESCCGGPNKCEQSENASDSSVSG